MPLRTLVLILSCILFAFTVKAQKQLEPRQLHDLIMQGIHRTLLQQYDAADSVFTKAASEFPNNPVGLIYRAGVVHAKAMDYELLVDRWELESLLDPATKLTEQLVRQNPMNPWAHYFRGMIDGYESFTRVQRGDWFGGVTKGLSSVSSFRDALLRDSTLVDANLGIGTYLYWKSRKTEFLHWLPFVSDDRDEGVALLNVCVDRCVYNRFAALSALVSIYLDENDFKQSLQMSEAALREYPRNRIFLWGKATALDRMNEHAQAIEAYRILLNEIVADSTPNRYNEIVCRLNLAKSLMRFGEKDNAKEELRKMLVMQKLMFPVEVRSRANKKFEEASELLRELNGKQ